MAEIHCEFCGPTRIAPHDVNCPKAGGVGPAVNPALVEHVDQQVREMVQVHRGVDFIGYTDIPRAFTHPLLDPNYLLDFFPATIQAMREQSPIVELATVHATIKGRYGAECKCGYNPHNDHPEAGRGQLFAYVGHHIREVSSGNR